MELNSWVMFSVMTGDLAKGSDSRMDVGDYKMDVKNGCENLVFNLLNLLPIYFLWTSYVLTYKVNSLSFILYFHMYIVYIQYIYIQYIYICTTSHVH